MSTQNSNSTATPKKENNKGTDKANANVDTTGLETAKGPISKHKTGENTPLFTDLQWLQNANPADYHSDEQRSSKYNAEREVVILAGLAIIANLKIGEVVLNPLLVQLGRWWEVKSARAAIKEMIDAEAELKGFTADQYMQVELAKQIDDLAAIQSATDRLRYAKTYFKPRGGVSNKTVTKNMNIDGKIYAVPVRALEEARAEFGKDTAKIKAKILPLSTLVEEEIEQL